MTPQQQGRFCDSCQKCVVDFTGFTDAQLYQFIAEHKGQKVCGRFRSTQLNRQINIPPQPHSQLYKWIIAAGLALVFVAAPEGRVFAQAPLVAQELTNTHTQEQKDSSNKENTFTIKGTVVDENKEPIINAVVTILLGNATKGATVTDLDGNFEIGSSSAGTFMLMVKSLGYDSYTKMFEINRSRSGVEIVLNLDNREIMGDMIHIEYKVPLINPFEGGTSKTITSDEIERGAW